jgi:hypothetical protein
MPEMRYGKRDVGLGVLLTLALAGTGTAGAARAIRRTAPHALMQVERRGKSVLVTFAPVVQRAVQRHFPGYRTARREDYDQEVIQNVAEGKRGLFVPFAVTGDFDGNRLPDIALMLVNRQDQWLLVALHQQPQGGFRPYRLHHWKTTDIWTPGTKNRSYVERVPPGSISHTYTTGAGEAKIGSLKLKNDAVEQVFVEEGLMVFYFRNGKYRSVGSG